MDRHHRVQPRSAPAPDERLLVLDRRQRQLLLDVEPELVALGVPALEPPVEVLAPVETPPEPVVAPAPLLPVDGLPVDDSPELVAVEDPLRLAPLVLAELPEPVAVLDVLPLDPVVDDAVALLPVLGVPVDPSAEDPVAPAPAELGELDPSAVIALVSPVVEPTA
jgi:hypothetical protein